MAIAINGNGTITGITAGGLPDASIVDADIAAVASSKLTGAVPVAKGGTGLTAPSTSGNVLTSDGTNWTSAAAAGGGDSRNFIIDGDFTQWPQNTTFADHADQTYLSALFQLRKSGAMVFTVTRDTDVPTYAQSGHLSLYSLKMDCTTADSSIASGDWAGLQYQVTGSDYAHLHGGQNCILSFWVKSTKTGIFTIGLQNRSLNRTMPVEYTISASNTWEKKDIAITTDTTGTWDLDESQYGLRIMWIIASGSGFDGTNNTWSGGGAAFSTSNQVNATDSTSNNFAIAQVGLYKTSSAPAKFLSEPISTVREQVEYYIQRWNLDHGDGGDQYFRTGYARAANHMVWVQVFNRSMRKSPVMRATDGNTFNFLESDGTNQRPGGVTISYFWIDKAQCRCSITTFSGLAIGCGQVQRYTTSTCWMEADARH